MQHVNHPPGHCQCGRSVDFERAVGSGTHREVACVCRRRHDVAFGASGWTSVAELTPELSVPLSGFSAQLRHADDAERFWFPFALQGGVALPVHILISPSAKIAEVKAADLKVFRIEAVGLPTDARRRWIAWWQERRPASRSRGPSPIVPSRLGRWPAPALGRRPAAFPVR
ncbi:MAG TPA: hypothetical protein VN032_07035 [Thermoanaerobaculia bacterium]|jgi:hypothetical protein|nr:hypothetical protein [Thermoanaerobaculia bacterium]